MKRFLGFLILAVAIHGTYHTWQIFRMTGSWLSSSKLSEVRQPKKLRSVKERHSRKQVRATSEPTRSPSSLPTGKSNFEDWQSRVKVIAAKNYDNEDQLSFESLLLQNEMMMHLGLKDSEKYQLLTDLQNITQEKMKEVPRSQITKYAAELMDPKVSDSGYRVRIDRTLVRR